MAYVRTVKTASGARAVQIVHSQRRGSRDIEHIGSAHTDADLELLKAAARQRLAAGQGELDLRLPDSPANHGEALPITSYAGRASAGRAGPGLRRAGVRRGDRARRGVQGVGAGQDHRTDQQAATPCGCWMKPALGRRRTDGQRRLRVYATGELAVDVGAKTEGGPVADGVEPQVVRPVARGGRGWPVPAPRMCALGRRRCCSTT